VILVDSSVWIDFFRNQPTAQAEWLDKNLGIEGPVVGDLILAEVLRGFKDDRGFNEARSWPAKPELTDEAGPTVLHRDRFIDR
jgi:predicted nucleic acid-binding protein